MIENVSRCRDVALRKIMEEQPSNDSTFAHVKSEIGWAVKNKERCRDGSSESIRMKLDTLIHDLNIIDFDRLIVKAVEMLKDGPSLVCEHLIVDECQDLSLAQIDIVLEVIKRSRPSVFTVGDNDQGVFNFCSGSPTPLLQRVDAVDVPVRHLVQLPINYRSTEKIVAMIIAKGLSSKTQLEFENQYRQPNLVAVWCRWSVVTQIWNSTG